MTKGKKIVYVNGFDVRNLHDPEFGICERRNPERSVRHACLYIPEGEIWIDEAVKDETDSLVAVLDFEDRYLRADTDFRAFREILKKEFADPASFDLKEATRRTYEKKGSFIREVDGGMVREKIDPYFVLGGHHLVYEYIPEGEIWLDAKMSKEVLKYTLVHECVERVLMERGVIYDTAHDYATATEKEARRRDGIFLAGDEEFEEKAKAGKETIMEKLLSENTEKK